uniref:Methyltransferase like 25B n=1 Tax=Dicentrarchus labrax TaxID=13489 RepID=A0A8P4PYG1_DICLA
MWRHRACLQSRRETDSRETDSRETDSCPRDSPRSCPSTAASQTPLLLSSSLKTSGTHYPAAGSLCCRTCHIHRLQTFYWMLNRKTGDILRCGLCHSWRSVPQLTLWRFPGSAGGSEAGWPTQRSLRSSWKTKVRAHCWGTYSGNTSSPRNSTRSASWAWYRIAYLLQLKLNLRIFFLFLTCFFLFIFESQLVKQLCEQTDCSSVVDVGSGQGHLTRFLSFGLGLSVTAIEADHNLVAMASKFDGQLLWALEKERQKKNGSSLVPVSQSSPRHVAGWVNPKASWEAFIKQLRTPDCVNDGPPTPSGPYKKRLRGSEHRDCSQVIQTSSSHSQDFDLTSQRQFSKNGSEEESSAEHCCSCVRPEENSQRGYPDFILTGLHACGDLSATLLRHFVNCPHVRGITSVACCYMKITTKENPTPPGLVECPVPPTPRQESLPSEFGYPMSAWVRGLPGHQLSYKAREGACHAVEDYVRRLREENEQLRTHCYRATLETFIRDTRPDLRRAGIQTIKKAHLLPFTEYARLGLARVGLPPGLPLDPERVAAMLKQQGRVVVYFSLALLLAPVVETLVLLDRMIYLQENGVDSQLVPLFDPNFSPRNFVLVALKARG